MLLNAKAKNRCWSQVLLLVATIVATSLTNYSVATSGEIETNSGSTTADPIHILHEPTPTIQTDEKAIGKQGAVFLCLEKEAAVRLDDAFIFLTPGCLVFTVMNGGRNAVFNLDTRKAVAVRVKETDYKISSGRCLVWGSAGPLKAINPAPFIGYRNVTALNGKSSISIFGADFDIRSLFCLLKSNPETYEKLKNSRKNLAHLLARQIDSKSTEEFKSYDTEKN